MKQIPLYSLVIFPTPEQSVLVKFYKQALKDKIGWYGSANAAAHITLINFDDEVMFTLHREQIREFCRTAEAQTVTLNHWDSFGDRTFFMAPDASSQLYLNKLIANLHQHLGFKVQNAHAHLSIARGLDAHKMKAAYELFQNTKVHMAFRVDAIHVRRFNEQTRQYSDIIEIIDFRK